MKVIVFRLFVPLLCVYSFSYGGIENTVLRYLNIKSITGASSLVLVLVQTWRLYVAQKQLSIHEEKEGKAHGPYEHVGVTKEVENLKEAQQTIGALQKIIQQKDMQIHTLTALIEKNSQEMQRLSAENRKNIRFKSEVVDTLLKAQEMLHRNKSHDSLVSIDGKA